MLLCFLFGLCVLLIMFAVPLGTKLCRTSQAVALYKKSILTIYMGGVLWFTILNRFGIEVSRVRTEPFTVLRLLAKCYIGKPTLPARVCKNALKNSQNLFDSIHATPIEDLSLNIILLMPLGFLLPYIWPKLNFYKTLLVGFAVSFTIETTQYLAHWGCLDFDDIFNNTLGSCLGYGCFKIYKHFSKH